MAYNTKQPEAVPQMVAAGGNRNVKNLPFNGVGEREWSYSFWGCFDDAGTCFLSCLCPCVVYAQNKSRADHLEKQGYPHPDGGASCNGDCGLHGCLTCCGCGWVLQIGLRAVIRTRYRIAGGTGGDCLSAFCCTPCELTQGSRELELEEQSMRR